MIPNSAPVYILMKKRYNYVCIRLYVMNAITSNELLKPLMTLCRYAYAYIVQH